VRAYRWLAAWSKAHPFAADGVLAAFVALVTVPALWGDPEQMGGASVEFRDPEVLGFVLLVLAAVPLAWRRRAPLAVLAVISVAVIAYELLGYATSTGPLGVLIALYTVGAHCERRRSRIALALTLVGVLIVLIGARWEPNIGSFVSNFVVFGTAWLIGDNLQTRRAYVAQLEERAARAEADREEEARRAAEAERTRIARELHDVVAHSMSVMVVQASAGRRVLDRRPDQAAEALASIETTGRQAMNEMRRLLGVLREPDRGGPAAPPDLAPQPSLKAVRGLVEQCQAAGMRVALRIEGEVRDLPPGVELSAYRIVQEALTNTMKHAGEAQAEVYVCYTDDVVEVQVRDDGRGASALDDGSGNGLLGMRERVDVYGGTFSAGPQVGGGFAVKAVFPVAEISA
jgi:signal transduction histidine kinase